MAKPNPLIGARLRKADALAISGQAAAAEPLYASICASDRMHVEAHCKHSETARRLGLYVRALASAERALALAPRLPLAQYLQGAALQCMGRTEDGIAAYDRALRLDPAMFSALYLKGNALIALGQESQAIPCLRQALAVQPGMFAALNDLGTALTAIGARDEARAMFQRALQLRPDATDVLCNLGALELAAGNEAEALRLHAFAHKLAPDSLDALASYANVLELTGRVDEAQALLAPVLARQVDHVGLLLVAARLARRRKDLPAAIAFLEQARGLRCDATQHQELCTLLGQIHDRQDAVDLAWPLFVTAKEALARGPQTYPERLCRIAEQLLPELDHCPPTPADSASDTPVFLIGFPRSGTTLLEQMLDAHPALQAVEERPMVPRMGQRFLDMTAGRARPLHDLETGEIAALRAGYFEELAPYLQRAPGTLLIDKLPLNIVWVPLIWRVFPQAKFILALRHPCDCCLSCFMQNFGRNEAMRSMHSMLSTAQVYAQVLTLWQRYAAAQPLPVHRIKYEELVRDPAAQIRALLDFLGVGWDPAVLDHIGHAQTRTINTPSYHQVVQPLYAHASGRWQRYSAYLADALPVLQPFVGHFGYSANR